MRFTITGSGTSHGVPVINCSCPVCTSENPKDKRTRTSAIIEHAQTVVVIDAGPDFRFQALKYQLKKLDALLITHSHADHIHGLDDVRIFSVENCIPVYANQQTLLDIQNRFDYVFKDTQIGGGKPKLHLLDCKDFCVQNPLKIGTLSVIPVPMKHGCITTIGWRFEKIAYLTDLNELPESSFTLIQGIDVLIIDALRKRPHVTHCSFQQALAIAAKTSANKIYFTHICHDYTHEDIKKIIAEEKEAFPRLKNKIIEPAYDGLEIIV